MFIDRLVKLGAAQSNGNHAAWGNESGLFARGLFAKIQGLDRVDPVSKERQYLEAVVAAAEEIGALPDSRIAESYANGAIDKYEASYLAFRTRYRHHFTDYHDQWNSYEVQQQFDDSEDRYVMANCIRDELRDNLVEDAIPGNWPCYLAKYGFESEIAKALAATLEEPKRAHPVWFKRAEQAVARAIDNGKSIDLNALTYELVRRCIDDWLGRRPKWRRPR